MGVIEYVLVPLLAVVIAVAFVTLLVVLLVRKPLSTGWTAGVLVAYGVVAVGALLVAWPTAWWPWPQIAGS